MTAKNPSPMQQQLEALQSDAAREFEAARDLTSLEAARVKYLGRNGAIREVIRRVASLPSAQRPLMGKLANEVKRAIELKFEEAARRIGRGTPRRSEPTPDLSLPGKVPQIGHLHPITQTIEAICDIFARMGFERVQGPEVELDYYNFEALNIPPDHPSRDSFGTFFVKSPTAPAATDVLLRSQTSTVQVRVMQSRKPPIRIIAPGKVYRPDTVDASHSFLFHQIEGLAVDEDVTMADLKHVLLQFARAYFGESAVVRLRPHFFPFTEPSVEVDVSCFLCEGKGCSVCSRKGWLEILGAGMVDPNVFEAVGYDPERYTGFAFGMGVERIAMLKHGIDDIRLFLENDLRFLRQF